MTKKSADDGEIGYVQKVWIAAGISALVFVFLWLFQALFNVLLMLLAAVLIACFFRGLAEMIGRKLKWPSWLRLTISVVVSLSAIVLLFMFIGSKVQSQVSELTDTLPATVESAKAQLQQTPVGQKIMKQLTSNESQQKIKDVARQFFSSTFGMLGDLYVILFLGIFFTVNPGIYKKGLVLLIPPKGRDKGKAILDETSLKLTKWLKGKLYAMLVVFVLTLIGLLILDLPMALALALLAGILNFIPNFGPILALAPAALVGWTQGTNTALIVVGLYIFIQVLESNFITPGFQKKLVSIPPALIIMAQLVMGSLSGFLGILLATPLVLIVIILVNKLYIVREDSAD